MNKVMTRAQHRPGTRPAHRRDSRRPAGAVPPRTPAGTAARAPSPDEGRPSPGARLRRPADNRPPSTTARAASVRASRALSGRETAPAVPSRETAPGVPARAPHRPAVPQPRPTDRFAELLLAVLSGQRPVHAMLRHTAGRAYDELARLAEHGPLRTRGARPVVRDIGYFVPREGALEVFARIGAGDRLRALAFRLERGRDLRWRCTAVELGGPRPHRAEDR
ncbi:Rv3235 family protein [Streptomyces viridosporus]|uniref:Rv3235 family protein n=1 Tax=Streptomyces viridosporus TaxID=67581 RepID=UPI0036F6F1C2